ncbi:DUF3857 domain-containing protein [Sphingobacterium suaedae]|uniref:DUF3857 domain-containing protein n=1 Tax=Sphingobacterium suaedae TaxID=1686402 RepID=A0ABW5KHK8_9SPHI
MRAISFYICILPTKLTMVMRLLLTAFFILTLGTVFSQEHPIPSLKYDDLTKSYQQIDSNASAVVVDEWGKTELEVVEADHALRVVHTYAVRIKILKKEGVDYANFQIPLYAFGNTFETIADIKGKTYNLRNTGISESEMNKQSIFLEKTSPFLHLAKFTLPQVEEGSIIDVQYRIFSPDVLNFRTWQFQTDIPKIHSAYTAIMPATYQYRVVLRGPYKLTDTKTEVLRSHFLLNGVRNDCSKITYVMDSVPAFLEEEHMLASKNYKSAVYFELEQYYLTNGSKVRVTKEWRDVDRELLTEKSFGGQLKKEDLFQNLLPTWIATASTDLEKAMAIYDHLKRTIRWNQVYGKYAQFGIKESLEQHKGNIGDINLALITALNAASLPAYPVLVSTRENGIPNNLHPVISDFNYVIASVTIDGKSYFLDASEAATPFGELPLRCINEQGRIIYSKKSSEWIPLKNEQPSLVSFTFLGQLDTAYNLTGKLTISYKGLDALKKRNEIASFNSQEEYFERMQEKIPNIGVKKSSLQNLDSLKDFLYEQLEIEMPMDEYVQNGILHINPIFINRTLKNPFNLNERFYPVDLGAQRHVTHNVNIRVPEGFIIHSSPKNSAMKLPEDAARFMYQSSIDKDRFVLRQVVSLNKAIYSVDEYFHLKEFFSRVIQQQQQELVITGTR